MCKTLQWSPTHTLTLRQSSDWHFCPGRGSFPSHGTSGLWCAWTHPYPLTVALYGVVHGVRGCGGLHRLAPPVDAAKGTPRKTLTPVPVAEVSTCPTTGPSVVVTVTSSAVAAAASTAAIAAISPLEKCQNPLSHQVSPK